LSNLIGEPAGFGCVERTQGDFVDIYLDGSVLGLGNQHAAKRPI
jgi:hypothetical protein